MKALLVALLVSLGVPPSFAAQLTVTVTGLSGPGEIHLAVYDDPKVFEGDTGDSGGPRDGIIAGAIEPAGPEPFLTTFALPPGTYALGLFHDLNGNGVLDKNLFGIPKEPYGFSKNARGRLGPPSFEDAAISVTGDQSITIRLD